MGQNAPVKAKKTVRGKRSVKGKKPVSRHKKMAMPAHVVTLSGGYFLGRLARKKSIKDPVPAESAGVLVKKAGEALTKPGLRRSAIFRWGNPYAYSVDPSNPERIIRESVGGKRTYGRFSHGRFKSR